MVQEHRNISLDIPSLVRQLALSALPVLIAITFHEVSHGFIANKLGDPTAKMLGRLTLNPLAHIDLFGTILLPLMLILFGSPFVFGYAKPVPINPMNFKNPRRDMALSAAGGPATNFLLAVASVLAIKLVTRPAVGFLPPEIVSTVLSPADQMLQYSIFINVALATFNLIPVPPLDGGRVVVGFLPHKQAISFSRIEPYGFFIVILLIATHIADYFMRPLMSLFIALLSLL
jgi:Zn-dependent protease